MNNTGNDQKRLALEKMKALSSRSEKCTGEIRQKLSAFRLSAKDVEEILEELQSEKFVDDHRYVSFFTRDKFRFNQWGRIKIRQALLMKGLGEELADEGLDQIGEDEYYQLLFKLLEAKNRGIKDQNMFSRKARLFRFAAQRGFESALIYKVIDELVRAKK